MRIHEIINILLPTKQWKLLAIVLLGVACGLGAYTVYASRAWSYLSDEPATCVNCHIMAPYYATWSHSSHGRDATCNDCHVPQDNFVNKWFFKGKDGLRHAAVFTMRGEPQVMQAIDESSEVIMNNCIRCHTQLNTEFVKTGQVDYHDVKMGEGKACWDCHREVPHGGKNSLSSTPSALIPYPKTNVPDWLKKKK
ncbi:cytochrome c nitrite reductase small subunit [Parabacteroides sp. PF5-5]|uniref:cytochrome c nitrite reductase small subunit n=1 Tax=unclassified Parabacteroides TaxID=2649774 RepID=UPI002475D1C4|nr:MULTISPECIES: cytochrome c nitrite reductase small subunit [unclassified Parabacteroides]MDH6304763.1 cytochrome c nitrite reductase small subunit [Parabacteroides sp. PH5-39]MDH6315622.1 cytochrome c nitrite reductase small subunit [Parabacteroides sp. PF5-13]MDH6319283.1 cytochrome c nitrite reductase small subunit [Parabacteroides sp. PH5-13]MDH6323014.1 cytochrome c nitrite reductase small subunit [Parabacteroides sp. PH5-8]MDH6326815.1 cytochrome c nitrite reductase small subunit [Para